MLPQATIDAANAEIMRVFETTSVIWRTIPRWNTGDPTTTAVPSDAVTKVEYGADDIVDPLGNAGFVDIVSYVQKFELTHADATDGLDAVLAAAGAVARALCGHLDAQLINELEEAATSVTGKDYALFSESVRTLQGAGYRAARALYANTAWFDHLNSAEKGNKTLRDVAQPVLNLSSVDHAPQASASVLLGRAGGGDKVSAGSEPVDVAVAVAPSLDYLGVQSGAVILAVRVACALRIKDAQALVKWTGPKAG